MILNLFSGPGGWCKGAQLAGLTDLVGIEYDRDACLTRAAAGHATIRADVSQFPVSQFAGIVKGLIASPPCPTFSNAGKGAGRAVLDELLDAIEDQFVGLDTLEAHVQRMKAKIYDELRIDGPLLSVEEAEARAERDAREAALSVQPARYIYATRPEWIAMEQVPAVMPLWDEYVRQLQALGYSAWAGILNAADYGVPQTRRRAILMASRVRIVAPPETTHCRGGAETLFGQLEPWVSMAKALGWGMTARPSTTVLGTSEGGRSPLDGGAGARGVLRGAFEADDWEGPRLAGIRVGFPRLDDKGDSEDGYRERDWRGIDEPAFALTEKSRSWVVATGMNSMKHSRDKDDMVPFERTIDEPAPTLDTSSGSKWTVGPEGHRQPPHSFKNPVIDRRNTQKAGGGAEGREPVPPVDGDRLAPTLTTMAGEQWVIREAEDGELSIPVEVRRGPRPGDEPGANLREGFDAATEPAQTVTSHVDRWQIQEPIALNPGRTETQPNRRVTPVDEPAPTIAFGHDAANWGWVPESADPDWPHSRPATTIAGDDRVFPPGGHTANDGRDNSKMVGRSENTIKLQIEEAAILQSFPADYPFQGTRTAKFRQVGDAMPPRLAGHVLAAVTGGVLTL